MNESSAHPPPRRIVQAIGFTVVVAALGVSLVATNRAASTALRTAAHDTVAFLAPDVAKRMLLRGVRVRAETADAMISEALALPPVESVDRLRHLLRYHAADAPRFEGDEGWAVRIRALRAIGASPPDLRPNAIPELVDVMTRDCGTAAQESRMILLGMECRAIPATPLLLGLLETGDDFRAELAVSVLSRLAIDCGDGFTARDSAVRTMIQRVRDPNASIFLRCRLLDELHGFDRTGAECGEWLRDLALDMSAPEAVRDHARGAIVQMGLDP